MHSWNDTLWYTDEKQSVCYLLAKYRTRGQTNMYLAKNLYNTDQKLTAQLKSDLNVIIFKQDPY